MKKNQSNKNKQLSFLFSFFFSFLFYFISSLEVEVLGTRFLSCYFSFFLPPQVFNKTGSSFHDQNTKKIKK
jgi:hypothetical protein